jgi:hypothetical protein
MFSEDSSGLNDADQGAQMCRAGGNEITQTAGFNIRKKLGVLGCSRAARVLCHSSTPLLSEHFKKPKYRNIVSVKFRISCRHSVNTAPTGI